MRIGLSEERLSWWATAAAVASFMLSLFCLLLMFGAVSATAGDYAIASAKGFWIGVVLLVGYIVSIYLLNSLVGKVRTRRLGSWAFAVAFHGLMLIFGATVLVS